MRAAISLGLLASLTAAGAADVIKLSARKPTAPLKRRSLQPTNVPLDDFFLNTDLQWYGNITVGTPPQELTVVFDTGSFTLEVASVQCGSACSNQKLKYDPSKSSTYVDGGQQTTLAFGTGVGVDPVVNNDYVLTVETGTDTVSVGGYTVENVDLYTIVDQTPKFNLDPFSGIQGLSPEAQGLFQGLVNQGLPSLFGMYLTAQSVGGAELTLGGIDTSKYSGSLTYTDLASSGGNWEASASSIAVNGQTSSNLNSNQVFIFDSGTSNIVLDPSLADDANALISPDIQPFSAEPGAYGIPCSKISSLPAVIDFTFTSQSGNAFNLTIPSSELNVGPFDSDNSTCQTLINSLSGTNIIGGSLLKHYYSVWDVGQQRLGFAANGH
ncbi:hypothetical protein SERLA73DRAFT_189038 [Serpula lacrymans var. lacrymans S7.3]|uniref:Peptidase A1 domain-containing protein n=2 Tax=Serpula lacrymans var. lacrymans TaxID=341189 RepID=F8QCQ0_SERL3|nr:uncharacterized protein SERLADRAFT_479683 [Serpula lacrymans var. lacrymans S7.9]EGN93915.1 hypothetical protein SERLA73DRAFT_189038 [Serpula lacrymans var. lacrymans S7.3]EGO19281.1 hypothetical protein SERLADRAFT_479683 [Serpula lacrymans var. lacrymans S7.9]